jgi:8-oxo-dGTP diphosphatase
VIRALSEYLTQLWPINRILYYLWRHLPLPRGVRSRFIRGINDHFLVGVMALIVDDSGRVLLVRNTYDPRHNWSLPGGWMGRNEQPEACIQRELLEETGFTIEVESLVVARTQRKLPSVDLLYRARITGGSFASNAEVSEVRYFPVSALPDQLVAGQRKLIESIEEHLLAEDDHRGRA